MWIVCPKIINHTNPIVPVLSLIFYNERHAKRPSYFRLRFTWLCHCNILILCLTTSRDVFWLVFSPISARGNLLIGSLLISSHRMAFFEWSSSHSTSHDTFWVGHFSVIHHVTYSDRSFTSRAVVMIFYTNLAWIFMYFISNVDSYLPPLRFLRVGGYWDWTQDCCDFDIWRSDILTTHLDLIRPRLGLIHTRIDLIHNSARSHQHPARSHPHSARSHLQLG
jgi:hypothetical protein